MPSAVQPSAGLSTHPDRQVPRLMGMMSTSLFHKARLWSRHPVHALSLAPSAIKRGCSSKACFWQQARIPGGEWMQGFNATDQGPIANAALSRIVAQVESSRVKATQARDWHTSADTS